MVSVVCSHIYYNQIHMLCKKYHTCLNPQWYVMFLIQANTLLVMSAIVNSVIQIKTPFCSLCLLG